MCLIIHHLINRIFLILLAIPATLTLVNLAIHYAVIILSLLTLVDYAYSIIREIIKFQIVAPITA